MVSCPSPKRSPIYGLAMATAEKFLTSLLARGFFPFLLISGIALHAFAVFTAFSFSLPGPTQYLMAYVAYALPGIAELVLIYFSHRRSGSWINAYSFWVFAWLALLTLVWGLAAWRNWLSARASPSQRDKVDSSSDATSHTRSTRSGLHRIHRRESALRRGVARLRKQAATPAPQRVIVVEDSADGLGLILRALGQYRASAWGATNARAALSVMKQAGPFDIAMVDVCLPDIDGKELAQRMRAMNPGISVIFMTGDRAETEVLAASGEVVLRKPFSIFDVAQMLGGDVRSYAQQHARELLTPLEP